MEATVTDGGMMRKIVPLALLAIAVVSTTYLLQTWTTAGNTSPTGSGVELTIYRTEQCPCCKDYEAYLRSRGAVFRTVTVDATGLENMRKKLGVPKELYSCHTAQAGPYFVEGHVPVEAIARLFSEKPTLDGIAVPGMPAGSPGMGGVKTEPLKIYAKTDGKISVWMVS
ncbi:MAG: DUF411 domain-containing protein [Candidatus Caldarchaeum sp.]